MSTRKAFVFGMIGMVLFVFAGCVIAVARCEACLKINAFDALNLDCDQADDQIANRSCP